MDAIMQAGSDAVDWLGTTVGVLGLGLFGVIMMRSAVHWTRRLVYQLFIRGDR